MDPSILEIIGIENGNSYTNKLSQESSKVFIFQCVMSVIYIFAVIPSNVFTLIVIAKTKSLWTPTNAILAINAFFMALGSSMILFLRQANFPLILYDEKTRLITYAVAWWVATLTFRIGNNRYLQI